MFVALFLYLIGLSFSAPIPNCGDQIKCFDLSFHTTPLSQCEGTECGFQVCVTVNTSRDGCAKAGATISHGCFPPNNTCASTPNATGDLNSVTADNEFSSFYECVDARPGEYFTFILKDGNAGNCSSTLNQTDVEEVLQGFPAGTQLTCGPRIGDTSCTGVGNEFKECVWSLHMSLYIPCPGNSPSPTAKPLPSPLPSPATSPLASYSPSPSQSPSPSPSVGAFIPTGGCQCPDALRTPECIKEEDSYAGFLEVDIPGCNFTMLEELLAEKFNCKQAACGGTTLICTEHIPDSVIATITECLPHILVP